MKLNLGCGPHTMAGWLNIDTMPPTPDRIQWDLSKGLPMHLITEPVTVVYSEHLLEHLTHDEGCVLLKDIHKILMPDGVLRLSTPDLRFLIECYQKNDIMQWSPTWAPKSPCSMMNEGMSLWGHRFLYDENELVSTLTECGFRKIYRVPWRKSVYTDAMNLEVRPYVNDLIIEAIK